MIRKSSFCLIFFCAIQVFYNSCVGQNFVTNPSFENKISCPSVPGEISKCFSWASPYLSGSTPDYFNSCDLSGFCGVPVNQGENNYQVAKTGDAYAGLLCNQPFLNAREYLITPLMSSFESNIIYYISFYVSKSDICQKGVSTIGAYFSVSDTIPVSGNMLDVVPQIESPISIPLADTLYWMKISGSFKAVGGEKYLTIGNFRDDSSCGLFNTGYGISDVAYYFIDDVTVSNNPADCGIDTSVHVGIVEVSKKDLAVIIYPNPTAHNITLQSTSNTALNWLLLDITGKEHSTGTFTKQTSIDLRSYSKGVYLLNLRDGEGNVAVKRVFKE